MPFVSSTRLYKLGTQQLKTDEAQALPGTRQSSARQSFLQAQDLFEESVLLAKSAAVKRRHLEEEKGSLAQIKQKAQTAEADQKAAAGWLAASQLERDALRFEEAGEWDAALGVVRQAATRYAGLLREIEIENARQRDQDALATRQATARPSQDSTGSPAAVAPASTSRRPVIIGGPPSPLAAWISELGATPCDQELDPADEELLTEHISLLSSILQYDPQSGAVYLDYTNGSDLRGEVKAPRVPREYLAFHDAFAPAGAPPPFSFQANTKGFFYIPVPLCSRLKVAWDTQIHTMDKNGGFGCVIFLDPKKKNYLLNDGVHLGAVRHGDPTVWLRRLGGIYSQVMNHWFDKRREIPMRVEYESLETDSPRDKRLRRGRFSVTYDAGNFDAATNSTETKFSDRGFVGFHWHRVRFQAKRLRIWGVLDKKLAVALVRKKLAAKERRRSGEDAPAEDALSPDPAGTEIAALARRKP